MPTVFILLKPYIIARRIPMVIKKPYQYILKFVPGTVKSTLSISIPSLKILSPFPKLGKYTLFGNSLSFSLIASFAEESARNCNAVIKLSFLSLSLRLKVPTYYLPQR